MKRAEPYDTAGRLKPQWMKFVELLDAKQEVVTAKKLLEHCKVSLVDNRTLIEELAVLEVEEKESVGIKSNVEDFKPAPFFGAQPYSKSDAPFKSNLPQKHTPPLEADSLFRTKLSAKTNTSNNASNTNRVSVKEDMSPIPLPPSPLLQSTTYADDKSSVGKMGETSSTTIEENGSEPDLNRMALAPTEIVAQARSPPVTQLSEALLDLRVHDQEETRKTASSPSRCQQKATKEPQTDTETEFYNGDDTIVVDEEDESWGDDPTLAAGDQTLSLELAPLEIVDGLYNRNPTGKSSDSLKGLDTATVLETEVQPNVAVVA